MQMSAAAAGNATAAAAPAKAAAAPAVKGSAAAGQPITPATGSSSAEDADDDMRKREVNFWA